MNPIKFQKLTKKQVKLSVSRDRAEALRAKASEAYTIALGLIPNNETGLTEETIIKNATEAFLLVQKTFKEWNKCQLKMELEGQKIKDRLQKKKAKELAETQAKQEAELKAKEKEIGLLQGEDVVRTLNTATLSQFGSGLK